ncbi:NAD(P)-dependent alcohol dehydrogenase [Mycoplasmoides pneumoniae]|uniref:Probable NADP-dependent isopropanol dehydrogenase n=2 Tax=Mycoplasmoides pneumoniae TaxID=2104 RepID=ADH_MYCPN|nr:NAD(P)-dependent alcohol dehydrogenase [Mycoplasmoides pneumoniae]P75214.1 RecName: Full=Probable NADP-dependent isopropanol dehydrogenase [Mycoplasmoides pneumoniae M129]AAB95926.1 NADP-dependent alcohol dehydrogenase-like protein [Mycoplasmoides pneumoniae M129]
MKAYAMLKIGATGWIEKPRPVCGPNDAIIRPLAVAPCTSDVHTVWEGGIGERHNMVLGHEGCGVVDEVGSEVKSFKVGDRVLVAAITPEWNSVNAQAGYPMHSGGMLGGWKFSNVKDGMFAEYFHVNDAEGNLALMPEGMDLADACMLSDMIPTGFHANELADIQYGVALSFFCAGPVGLMAIAGAALKGAGRIIVVDSRPDIVEIAKAYGATDYIDFKKVSVVDEILKWTNNEGVEKVLISGGGSTILETAIKVLRPGGKIGNVNYFGAGEFLTIPRVEWGVGMAHKAIHGGLMLGGRLRLEKLARLIMTKKLDPSKMITHRFKGFEHIEEALFLMKDKPKDLIKSVVIF